MDPALEIEQIRKDIDDVRARLLLDRKLLADQLAPYGGNADTLDALLTAAEEFGADHVTQDLAANPAAYNLAAIPIDRLITAGALLTRMVDDNADMDRLVAARENYLAEANPGHERVYAHWAREFTLSADRTQLHWLDGAAAEPTTVMAVPNRAAPRHGPDADATLRRRRRRDRER